MRILVVNATRLIREMVSAIIRYEGYSPITASGASNAEELPHQADSAVYEAKESGRNSFICFSPDKVIR